MNVFADAEHWTGDDFELLREEHLLALTLIVIFEVLLLNRITRIQGVTGVHSSFVLRRVVDKTALPV